MKVNFLNRVSVFIVITTFVLNSLFLPVQGFAQTVEVSDSSLSLGSFNSSASVLMKGLILDPKDPFKINFVIDKGKLNLPVFQKESHKLVKYFLASLAIPENEMWVNLSPTEKNRIIPEAFGQTAMGRDMLAQDFILKQLTSSMLSPEDEIGKELWNRVYQKAKEQFGTTDIPLNTYNKVWIVPQSVDIYEYEKGALVTKSYLKVMMEEEYTKDERRWTMDEKSRPSVRQRRKADILRPSSLVIKEILLPEIEREVNTGKSFALLRQIFSAHILATWYKKTLKESLITKQYADQHKIDGLKIEDKQAIEKIYQSSISMPSRKGLTAQLRRNTTL